MNRNKILLLIFGVLLIVFLWKQFFSEGESRNFKEILVELDTARVTKIQLLTKANSGVAVDLVRTGDQWEVSNGTVKDDADQNSITGMLSSLVSLKPKRLVAKSEKKWSQYEVNDSLGTKVKVYAGEQELADLVVGKFNFQQNTRSMSTFVRLSDDEDVYSVEGFLSSTFNQEFSNLRDKTFLKTNKPDLTNLKFEYPGDSSFVLSKMGEQWSVDGLEADSLAVQTYLNGIQNITQRQFDDTFGVDGKVATYRLTVDGNNMNTIIIDGYGNADDLILHSSLNENAYFEKGNLQVFEQLFVSRTNLILQ